MQAGGTAGRMSAEDARQGHGRGLRSEGVLLRRTVSAGSDTPAGRGVQALAGSMKKEAPAPGAGRGRKAKAVAEGDYAKAWAGVMAGMPRASPTAGQVSLPL